MLPVGVMFVLVLALRASAQSPDPGDLVPIEQGVSDMHSVGTSLRVMPVDLGTGNTFSRLYGVAGRPDLLVRSQGGLYAVFEQSDYIRVQRGSRSAVFAVWPAGTVFHIGKPDFSQVRVAGIRHGPSATMLFAPGLQLTRRSEPDAARDARGPDPRLGERVGGKPADLRVPDARLPSGEIRSPGDARSRGSLPGYGHPVEPAAVKSDVAAPEAGPKRAAGGTA